MKKKITILWTGILPVPNLFAKLEEFWSHVPLPYKQRVRVRLKDNTEQEQRSWGLRLPALSRSLPFALWPSSHIQVASREVASWPLRIVSLWQSHWNEGSAEAGQIALLARRAAVEALSSDCLCCHRKEQLYRSFSFRKFIGTLLKRTWNKNINTTLLTSVREWRRADWQPVPIFLPIVIYSFALFYSPLYPLDLIK